MVEPNEPPLRSTIGWSQGRTLPLPDHETLHWGPATPDHARPVEPELERPRVLGFDQRYGFERLLGEGGMGRVALHEDRQIGRRVAIKQLLAHYRDDGAAERRFLREARIQAQLEHPAVVPVYDLGVDEQGQPWFAMKRVSGVTLAEIVAELAQAEASGSPDRAEWSQRRLLTALSQVCLAVDFAHTRGVIHRDLKPENVMLGEYGEVYVLDWGLAKRATNPAGATDHEGTKPGVVLGTPGFMAPEQVLGLPLGPAADVYALGAILFELLTLTPLHGWVGVELAAILRATTEGVEVRPSLRAPERGLAPELDDILVRALARDPGQRYGSARELHDALEAFLDGQRDVERRRELAREHAEQAVRLLASEDPGQRRLAMQSLGRSLALDPEDREATAILRRMLTEAPRQRPPAVDRALERSTATQRGWAGKAAAIAYLSILLYLPLLGWAGIRDLVATLPFFAAMLIAGLICLFGSWTGQASNRTVMAAMVVSSIGIACSTTLFGPLIEVPLLAAVNTTCYAVTFTDWRRWLTFACGVLAVVTPLALELAGVIPPSLRFTAEGMLVMPQAIDLPRTATLVILTIGAIAGVATGSLTVGWARGALLRAEAQLYTHAWQVQQLLPDVGEREGS